MANSVVNPYSKVRGVQGMIIIPKESADLYHLRCNTHLNSTEKRNYNYISPYDIEIVSQIVFEGRDKVQNFLSPSDIEELKVLCLNQYYLFLYLEMLFGYLSQQQGQVNIEQFLFSRPSFNIDLENAKQSLNQPKFSIYKIMNMVDSGYLLIDKGEYYTNPFYFGEKKLVNFTDVYIMSPDLANIQPGVPFVY